MIIILSLLLILMSSNNSFAQFGMSPFGMGSSGGGSFTVSNTVFVDVNGNDSNCTRGNAGFPCASIYQALNLAQSGDLVQLGPGSFNLGFTTAATVSAAGSSYVVGDIVTFSNASITLAPTFTVSSIGGGGSVTGLTLLTTGYGNYTNTGASVSATGGAGTGLTATLARRNARVPNGVYLKGSGMDITILTNGARDQGGTYVSCRANCRVSDLTIQTPTTIGVYAFPIGVDTLTGDQTMGVGNIIWNVHTTGWSDGPYYRNANGFFSASGWKYYNCIFDANFDTFNIFENDPDSGNWPLTVDFYNCIFNALGAVGDTTPGLLIRGIANTASHGGYVVTTYGGVITVANASGNTSTYRACWSHDDTGPHGGANGGTFQSFGTRCVNQTGGASAYSWHSLGAASPAAIFIAGPGTQYDVTRVSIPTSDSFISMNTIDTNGITRFNQNNAAKKPTLAICGTSPSVTGDDRNFLITAGTGSVGCAALFGGTYTIAPTCNVTPRTGSTANAFSYITSTSAVTVTQTGLGTGKVDVNCNFPF